jgi:cytidyltransferase-like protein
MFEYIFTIGCFDKFHKGHIKLLESMKEKTSKIIIGLHDNSSISKIKLISDIDSYESRKKNLQKYAYDIFMIDNPDPTKSIQEYILKKFNEDLIAINIGPSRSNTKVIENNFTGNLFFIHNYKDTFEYQSKDNKIIISRNDTGNGWGQNLIGYKKNWCFMRADDNQNFPSIDYVKTIMPIKYLPYSKDISATKLRDFKNDKVGLMNHLLQKVVIILNEHNIPYYLDCGTLLGCIRDNELMEKDTDIDVTIHISYWDKLNSINFQKYDLVRKRTLNGFPIKHDGNMISVKTKYSNLYCDIYTNPAFPQLDNKVLNGKSYNIPLNSELYLTQLYKNWKIPSNKHACTTFHRGSGLVNSEYSKYWDKDFEIYNLKW